MMRAVRLGSAPTAAPRSAADDVGLSVSDSTRTADVGLAGRASSSATRSRPAQSGTAYVGITTRGMSPSSEVMRPSLDEVMRPSLDERVGGEQCRDARGRARRPQQVPLRLRTAQAHQGVELLGPFDAF